MTADWNAGDRLFARQTIAAFCEVDIEQTPRSFHAYAVPHGIDIRPGDQVMVHDVPTDIGFGDHVACECAATVTRAGWLERQWTRAISLLDITELYEVGFSPRR